MTCKIHPYNLWRCLSKLDEEIDKLKSRLDREGYIEEAADVTFAHILIRRAKSTFPYNKKSNKEADFT